MIRTLTLAAMAALTFTSAQAASQIVVLKDKTSDQAKAEIAAAARAVCLREVRGVVYMQEAIATCIEDGRTQAMAEAEVTLAQMKAAETLAKK